MRCKLHCIVFSCIILAVSILTGCDFTYKIKSGQEAYDVKQFSVAVDMLQEEYSATTVQSEKGRKAFLLGQSYEEMGDFESALPWYMRAVDHNFGEPALAKYAETARKLEQYDEAISAYEQLMAMSSSPLRYRQMITICNQAREWNQNISTSGYEILPVDFNSPSSEYAPYVMGPDMVLFTSDRGSSTNSEARYLWTGRSFSDLYVVNKASDAVQNFDPTLNSDHNEGTVALSADRSEIYFTRCFEEGEYDQYCKLVQSSSQGASWSRPEVLSFVKEGINYMHPVLARNDSLLIFSSNDPEGAGGYDLYYSQREQNGAWGEPRLFSERVNSPGNEQFPSIHEDTLYFSSDYHPGMGGLDIFKTYLLPNGDWTPPYNLKPPVNSGWDDFGFVVDTFARIKFPVLQKGYFSSSRDGTDDIYAFTKRIPPEPEEEIVEETADDDKPDIDYQIFLAIRVVEPVYANPEDPNSERVDKRPLGRARVNIGEDLTMRTFRTDEQGYLVLEVEYDQVYNIKARFRGFLTQNRTFSTEHLEKDPENPVQTYNLEIVLDPIFEGKEIILENIYYDLDEWVIREDAKPALDSLATILLENPGIRIELGSHTDCRADDDYNLELSQKRAQSAVDYLISKGVDPARLVAIGYGETRFAIDCACELCTEEQHQANRRTTFKVIQ